MKMIHKLDPNDYGKVLPLFAGLEWNLITVAVIEGMCPGEIYVDDIDNPKTSLIVSFEGYYLAGDEKNRSFNEELRELLDMVIIPQKIEEGEGNISLNYHPATWESILGKMLEDRFPLEAHGCYYKFRRLGIEGREGIPSGFRMERMDEKFLEKSHLENMEKVADWIGRTWVSVRDFLKYGAGFCLVHDDTIVSWCLTDCAVGTRCEIGIETDENYRRRGLATLTVASTVDHLLSCGFRDIGWHTGLANIASMKTAERVGFEKVLQDTYYFFWFYPIDNFIEHGYFSCAEGMFRESANWYERAIAGIETEKEPRSFQVPRYHSLASLYFYAACSWAQAGEKGSSLKNLRKAVPIVKDRKRFLEHLKMNESLEGLHDDGGWSKLLESLGEK